MSMHGSRLAVFLLALAGLALGGCDGDDDGGGGPAAEEEGEVETIVAEGVELLPESRTAEVEATPSALSFPAAGNESLLHKQPGDILVSGTGQPFLRKIVAVRQDGDRIVVQTEQAALTESIEQGDFGGVYSLDGCEQGDNERVCPLVGESLSAGLDLSGTVLFEDAASGAVVRVARGTARLAPSLDVDGKVRRFRLQEFHLIARGDLEVAMVLEAEASVGVSHSGEVELWESPPMTLHQCVPVPIGCIPVWETVTVSLRAGYEVSVDARVAATAGAEASTGVSAGVRYSDGRWSAVAEESLDLTPVGPDWEVGAGLEARVYLRPQLDVLFYSVAGPFVALEPYAAVEASVAPPPPGWTLSAGLRGAAGGRVEFLDRELGEFDFELFDVQRELASGALDVGGEGEGEGPGEGEGEGPAEGEGEGPAEGEGEGPVQCGADCSREMVQIPAGEYMMGSPPGESGRDSDESLHRVRITRPFMIRRTEVTQAEWEAVMGANPSRFGDCGGSCPVEMVSWFEAVEFCNALSRSEGLEECYSIAGSEVSWPRGLDCAGYRLPTEAEWEYAARAGTDTAYYTGTDEAALGRAGWYRGNSGDSTHPVSQKEANAWGLYDMLGNVWEWTWDWYGGYGGDATDPTGPGAGDYRVNRGGSWYYDAQSCRAAYRPWYTPSNRLSYQGFRPARSR